MLQAMSRVGMNTAQLTTEELTYVDQRIVETVRPKVVGRILFPVFRLPHAGFTKVRGYRQTDMSQARISLHGQGKNKDRSEKESFDITVPTIHKEFTIWWRDLEATRSSGLPLDTQEAENAARQVAEEEDKLLLTGEHTGWPALGKYGRTGTRHGYCDPDRRQNGHHLLSGFGSHPDLFHAECAPDPGAVPQRRSCGKPGR